MAVFFISGQEPMFSEQENNIHRSTGLTTLIAWLHTRDVFGVDTETEGVMDFENKVIMLQIGDAFDQFVIDTRSIDVSPLKEFFESYEWLKIFHNAKFDANFLRFTYGWRTENVYDTFLAECCLTNGIKDRALGLAALTIKYCNGAQLDKTERGKFVSLGAKPYTHSNITYGARDVEYLMCIKAEQEGKIQEMGLQEVVDLECQAVLALADMEYNGIVLSAEKWSKLAHGAHDRIKALESKLDLMVLETPCLSSYKKKYVQQDIFGGLARQVDISWSSPLQMLKLLRKLGISTESSSEKEITKYQNSHPIVKTFIDYKKEQKLSTTYGMEFLHHINRKTGRIHTEFWQVLETHRISSNRPNLQQIPAKGEKVDGVMYYPYLECFVAPKGYKIVAADFSGQELRIIAEGSGDRVWVDAFNHNRDLHGEIAAMLFSVPLSEVKNKPEFVFVDKTKVYLRGKSPRDVAKTINFMLAFGGSKYKLSDTLGITVDEAGAIIDKYFKTVPEVKIFLEKLAEYGKKHSLIRSYKPYSLVRQFPDYNKYDQKSIGETERASKNTPIQGVDYRGVTVPCINPFNCWKPEMVISNQVLQQ